MLALIEIVLTVVAYRKGWKLKALLPLALSFAAAFLMGIVLGAGGGSLQRAMPAFFMIDLICLAALIGLCIRAPQSSATVLKDHKQTSPTPMESANFGSASGD